MKTLKALKLIRNKTFKKVVSGVPTVEDIPSLIDHYQQQVDAIDGASMKVIEGQRIEFNNGQLVLLPKLKRETIGELTVRPGGDYIFFDPEKGENSYGPKLSKKNVTFVDNGFQVSFANNMKITFTEA